MATFVLIPGAGCDSWYWQPLMAELRGRGHDAVNVDLPAEDDAAGLADYADAVVEQIGDRTGLIVVAHSFGGFTAPLVCERVRVDLLVMLTAMVPSPGEAPGEWWTATGHAQAMREAAGHHGPPEEDHDFDPVYYHDVPAHLVAEMREHPRGQSETPGKEPWPLPAWPRVPAEFLLCRGDRLFPAAFMRRVVKERLGIVPDEIDGGHMVMLSRPGELADRLVSYLRPDRPATGNGREM
ncbi:alpha/beta hydrolase [Actinoallomurus soli]|uniref:alpha/beta hydrolase n=1 Tax=Actinoallomurus soli TaxID=2952535 RepID=UPI002093074C|nr:alpha/beta hydrolase [Actinoallomurus soli]MCO5972785.1 alpha/beta hydrolase [Actinoallomurus soli]